MWRATPEETAVTTTPDASEASSPEAGDPSGRRSGLLLPLLGLAALVTASLTLPVQVWLDASVDWVRSLGALGPLAMVGLYVLACVLLVPGSVLTLGAGAVFGLGLGTATVFVGATAGASAAFLVGRHLAREWVAARVEGNPRFAAIDRAVGREGFRIVLLTRLSPVFPFNLLNYAYGLTTVTFRDYLFASIGMLPGTIMYVYLGSAASDVLGAKPDGSTTGEQVLKWVGLAITVVVTVFVTRVARRALAEDVDLDDGPAAQAG